MKNLAPYLARELSRLSLRNSRKCAALSRATRPRTLEVARRELREARRRRRPGSGDRILIESAWERIEAEYVRRWQERLASSEILRRQVREAAGESYGWPIEVVAGNAEPQLFGRGYYFRWRGKWKTAPGSYQSSTHRYIVGAGWLARYAATGSCLAGPRETRRLVAEMGSVQQAAWYVEEGRLAREAQRLNPYSYAPPTPDHAAEDLRLAAAAVAEFCSICTEDNGLAWASRVARKLKFAQATQAWADHRATQPTDDRDRIERPYLIAQSGSGLLIGDRAQAPRRVQLVVRDATSGLAHWIDVPPQYGWIGSGFFRGLHDPVQAAIAWTFGLRPEEYVPAVEA